MTSVIVDVCSVYVFNYMCMFVLCGLCKNVLAKSLLNMFTSCVGEMIFSLKVSVLFVDLVDFLLANPCIIFQIVCVLCL